MTTVDDCRLIDLPKVHDVRGNLTFVEGGRHLGYDIQRVFYLYDVPGGATRAGHALRTSHQLLIAISGSFDVILDDGQRRRRQQLNRSHQELYLPPRIWRELENFSSGSVCLVLASHPFDESDYCRDYGEFRPSNDVEP